MAHEFLVEPVVEQLLVVAQRIGRVHDRGALQIGKVGELALALADRRAVRIENRCDQEAPPLRRLSKGTEIRCQHTEAELLAAQELRD